MKSSITLGILKNRDVFNVNVLMFTTYLPNLMNNIPRRSRRHHIQNNVNTKLKNNRNTKRQKGVNTKLQTIETPNNKKALTLTCKTLQ